MFGFSLRIRFAFEILDKPGELFAASFGLRICLAELFG